MVEYCPHHETCPFYQNWSEQTRTNRLDVLYPAYVLRDDEKLDFGKVSHYLCYALESVRDGNTKINVGREGEGIIANPKLTDCSHLTILNGLINIQSNTKKENGR